MYVFIILGVLVLIIAVVILVLAKAKQKPKEKEDIRLVDGFRDTGAGEQSSPQNQAYVRQLLLGLKAQDPNFSEDLFLARVNNIFVQLQGAWESKDWKLVRPFESNDMFNTHAKQLQEYIVSQTTNMINDIVILRTEIIDYVEVGPIDNLVVYLRTRLKNFILDDATGQVVQGDPHREILMEYQMVLSRRKGVATKLVQNTMVSTCPNCGANVSINVSGACQYCGSEVGKGGFDWVLTSIDVKSQS